MSIPGISASSLLSTTLLQQRQNNFQKIQSEFQQLGQDLQAGNLTQAQQDFATLTQNAPTGQQQGPLAQAFNTLGQDLKSGNLSAAQQDYATIQQDMQQMSTQAPHHHHHHHGGGSQSTDATSQQGDALTQAFGALGQALQSGNLTSAQQAYATVLQDLQQFSGSSSTTTSTQAANGALNVSA